MRKHESCLHSSAVEVDRLTPAPESRLFDNLTGLGPPPSFSVSLYPLSPNQLPLSIACFTRLKINTANCIPAGVVSRISDYGCRSEAECQGSPVSFVRSLRRINRGSTASRTVCLATVEPPKKWRKTF